MFERFTDRARRVLVLAQEEARLLNHSFIGTEHLLLGLIQAGGVAAKALESTGITLEAARLRVEETVGYTGNTRAGSPAFSPRAKSVLQRTQSVGRQLGYVSTEHILLGIIAEVEGSAIQVLMGFGVDLEGLRQQVGKHLSGDADTQSTGAQSHPTEHALGRYGTWTATVDDSHSDQGPGLFDVNEVVIAVCTTFGPVPPDPGTYRGYIEDAQELEPYIAKALRRLPARTDTSGGSVRFLDADTAQIEFAFGHVVVVGRAVRHEDTWFITRDTVLQVVRSAGIPLPSS